jgi:hypothetical protein
MSRYLLSVTLESLLVPARRWGFLSEGYQTSWMGTDRETDGKRYTVGIGAVLKYSQSALPAPA